LTVHPERPTTTSATPDDPRAAFIEAGLWHGALEGARAILAAHPEIASSDIHTAAILGDDAAVRRFLAQDPAGATATAPPYGGDPLIYLCLSEYLRLDTARSGGFLRAARALLDAGADPNTGFWTTGSRPERETALYGAAGVAHHAALTRLLLERGADPNDGEVTYHAPETHDLGALRVLVESGRLTPDSLATMLLRKADWHDTDGIRYLLEHGADPNRLTHWGHTALHQAVRRDNALAAIDAMLDHGADPMRANRHGETAVSIAIRRGRGDLLAALDHRSFPITLAGSERLLTACARGDAAGVRAVADREPQSVREVVGRGGTLLAEFAGVGNTDGVRLLLDLGVAVDAAYGGDDYFDIAPGSTALHVAAWRAWPATVRLLIERGAPVNASDGLGRTALMLAVRACVDSHWTERRTPASVEALLQAGAQTSDIPFPTGYAEVDALLSASGI
jgi:ankyrin repeat protein